MTGNFRPAGFGDGNRRVLMTSEAEVKDHGIPDTSGNLIYYGKAIIGSPDSRAKWQLRKLLYNVNGDYIGSQWPQDSRSIPSGEYNFVWDSNDTTAITGISQANPGVVTMASNPFTDGDVVIIEGVVGMTEVNFDDTTAKMYIVSNGTGTTFELTDLDGNNVNTSAYTAYSSGGTVRAPEFANYTFA